MIFVLLLHSTQAQMAFTSSFKLKWHFVLCNFLIIFFSHYRLGIIHFLCLVHGISPVRVLRHRRFYRGRVCIPNTSEHVPD